MGLLESDERKVTEGGASEDTETCLYKEKVYWERSEGRLSMEQRQERAALWDVVERVELMLLYHSVEEDVCLHSIIAYI